MVEHSLSFPENTTKIVAIDQDTLPKDYRLASQETEMLALTSGGQCRIMGRVVTEDKDVVEGLRKMLEYFFNNVYRSDVLPEDILQIKSYCYKYFNSTSRSSTDAHNTLVRVGEVLKLSHDFGKEVEDTHKDTTDSP